MQPSDDAASSDSSIFQGYSSTSILHGDLTNISRWHQDVKPHNIFVKSKKGGSPSNYEFKLGDLGLSHFKKYVPSQGEATDSDTYGTRAYGMLHSSILPNFTEADDNSGAPECYRADSNFEKLPLLVKQAVDTWSLGCIFSEAAVWVVCGTNGLSEYRRRRGVETALIPDFRDGNCFYDGRRVLDTVTKIHRTLADDIRVCDHVTGAIVDMVTKAMLIEQDGRPFAKFFSLQTKEILREAETKLRRSASYAGTGSVSGAVAQSPPRTPPEPPPGHFQSCSTNSHSRHLPRHTYAGSLASTSYDEDNAHHQEPADDFFGKGASQQLPYIDRRNRRQSAGPVNHPNYAEYEDQDQFSENHLNRLFSEVGLSQDSPSSPSWQEPINAHRRRRRTPSDLFSGTNTRNGPDVLAQDRQETYNVSQRDSFTAPPGGVFRTSTATLVQNLHNGSRAGQHHHNMASGPRPPGLSSAGSSNGPPPIETQPKATTSLSECHSCSAVEEGQNGA